MGHGLEEASGLYCQRDQIQDAICETGRRKEVLKQVSFGLQDETGRELEHVPPEL